MLHQEFLKRRGKELIALIRNDEREPETGLGFVDDVLDEWTERFGETRLSRPTSVERSFWFALYLLEEIDETPGKNCTYSEKQKSDLQLMAVVLRNNAALPEGCWATRPDGC